MSRIITPASNTSRTLAFVGNGNFDLYLDGNNILWSVPKADKPSCAETCFGNRDHVLSLKRKGMFTGYKPTRAGHQLMDEQDTLYQRRAPVYHSIPAIQ